MWKIVFPLISLYIDQLLFLNKLLIFFLNKAYYQESYIPIIEHNSVVAVSDWLDGSFENQSRL